MSENMNTQMGWDSPIPRNAEDKNRGAIAPEGEYRFRITGFTRGTFQPNPDKKDAKIKHSCPQAELKLEVAGADGEKYEAEARVLLHESCVGILAAFARAIGQRKHGDAETVIDWSGVPGSEGACVIKHRKYMNKYGEQKTACDVSWKDPGDTQLDKDIKAGSVKDPFGAPF